MICSASPAGRLRSGMEHAERRERSMRSRSLPASLLILATEDYTGSRAVQPQGGAMTRSFPQTRGMSRRTVVAGGAALATLVPALAACGGDAQQSAPSAATQVKGAIRFSHLGDPKQAGFWTKAAGIFSQQFPQIQLTAEPT